MKKQNKKAISPIISVALLTTIVVIVTISFSGWFSQIHTGFQSEIESKSYSDSESKIDTLVGGNLYFTNKGQNNKTIFKITINGLECIHESTIIKKGSQAIDIESCIENLDTGRYKIIIQTEKNTYQETIFVNN